MSPFGIDVDIWCFCSSNFWLPRCKQRRHQRWHRHLIGIDIDLDVDLDVDINIDVSIEVGVKVNVCDVDVNVNFYLGNVGIEVDSNDGIAKGIVGVQLKFMSLYDLAIALIGLNFATECAFICPRVLLCHR